MQLIIHCTNSSPTGKFHCITAQNLLENGEKKTTDISQALIAYSSILSFCILNSREHLTYYVCSFQLLHLFINSPEATGYSLAN